MKHSFAVCVENTGYEASLELRKIYQVIHDVSAARHHQARVIDESGEDYLFPEVYFSGVTLPSQTKERIIELVEA